MWKTGNGAKQSTRRGGSSLTEDSQTEHERSVYASSRTMLRTNSSNDEEDQWWNKVFRDQKQEFMCGPNCQRFR